MTADLLSGLPAHRQIREFLARQRAQPEKLACSALMTVVEKRTLCAQIARSAHCKGRSGASTTRLSRRMPRWTALRTEWLRPRPCPRAWRSGERVHRVPLPLENQPGHRNQDHKQRRERENGVIRERMN